ncbi:tRNA pseudouridine synthase Pus10 [Hylaeus anthracinus]|uniref:tRNA pseudouridine synthase Pus10 n=1 Tax=Hylaeus volcanicus TaxID=313075 RepID=UPI0023B7F5B2|nr:tRNA pseudouridine synthase Pus10 [Hylaeus volcanicus]XP_053997734.1 tRNA pseudouridine synthase Pus10 [Hylaeus anthracinus]XP_053997735.1 tRNA pseudouridine synthase Pus10 [Hylaeus anthracinus]
MSLSIEEEKRIFNSLQKQNCCLRCCFRFICWRTQECYEDPIKIANSLGYITEKDVSSNDEVPCTACLGILQNRMQESVIQKIQTEVEKQNYDSETFVSALTVPTCVNFRERLLHMQCGLELGLSESALTSLKLKMQTIKDVWKLVITPKVEQAIRKQVDATTPSAFLIEIILMYKYNEKECESLLSMYKGTKSAVNKRKRKCNDNRFSRKSIETLMTNITDEEFAQCFKDFSLETPASADVENIVCSHSSIFIGGRYNKLSRELSQTPWFINGEKKMQTSVQDILGNPIAEAVGAQSIKFLSSGREDVDVRNIHAGRPFAIELINPRMTKITDELLLNLVDKINQSSQQVQITSNLKVLSRLDLKVLKEGENVKTKFYRALCICRDISKDALPLETLNDLKRVKIVQKTPVRVLHRRPLSPRIRLIYEMRARWAKPQELKKLLDTASEDPSVFFVLDIKTQAGTYVKEFVHGDFGRTKPSLCDILNTEVDIVALDVTGINLNWP